MAGKNAAQARGNGASERGASTRGRGGRGTRGGGSSRGGRGGAQASTRSSAEDTAAVDGTQASVTNLEQPNGSAAAVTQPAASGTTSIMRPHTPVIDPVLLAPGAATSDVTRGPTAPPLLGPGITDAAQLMSQLREMQGELTSSSF